MGNTNHNTSASESPTRETKNLSFEENKNIKVKSLILNQGEPIMKHRFSHPDRGFRSQYFNKISQLSKKETFEQESYKKNTLINSKNNISDNYDLYNNSYLDKPLSYLKQNEYIEIDNIRSFEKNKIFITTERKNSKSSDGSKNSKTIKNIYIK